jgi:glycosyltransferase involved in cell wall biosynthesis
MNKPVLVFQGPVGTRSGYGERSRDLVRALIALDKFDIKIVSTRWGSTPMNALTDNDQDILSRFLQGPLQQQPEIFMQVTVPNEFQKVGKFNIGVTAGIETNICDHTWIEGCNRMDLVLASSEHAKKVFEGSRYDKKDQNTGQLISTLQLQTPVEVLFEGVRLDKFKKEYSGTPTVDSMLKNVKEDFAFLFVGHWLPGQIGEDRKNVGGMIKSFYEAFKNKSNAPALILKTSGGTLSITDQTDIVNKINAIKDSMDTKNLPNVYIAYGDFTEEELNDLYNHSKVKAHVSFTKGEGFGRPLIEAAITGKPIITSNWSGHLDFLNSESSVLVNGQMTNVHPSAAWKGVLNQDAQWFTISYGEAISYMKDMFKNYKSYLEKSRKTYHHIKTNFSFDAMKDKLDSILDSRVPEFPKQVGLVLPKLQKVGNSQAPQITLPKLKKVEATEAPKITLPKLKKIE